MMNAQKKQSTPLEDNAPYWTQHTQLFTAQLPAYFIEPQKVWGRFHSSEEKYSSDSLDLLPFKKGIRHYVLMQPYVLEPNIILTVGLYKNPKQYADQPSPIGEVIGTPQQEGARKVQVGSAQAWYYPQDKTILLWECFFDSRFRENPFSKDANMPVLWTSFEKWLIQQFPDAKTLATPFNDPIANSREEYQTFLKRLGYSPLVQAVFGKKI
jgi:hypothetical protein